MSIRIKINQTCVLLNLTLHGSSSHSALKASLGLFSAHNRGLRIPTWRPTVTSHFSRCANNLSPPLTTMSDLDADLYGGNTSLTTHRLPCLFSRFVDLYGNDEPDFAEQALEDGTADASSQPEPPAAKPAAKPAAPPPPTSVDTGHQQSQSGPTSAPAPIAPFVPVTQQIPTYEQPQPSEYRNAAASSGDGAYQNISVSERSVRPSEMKDEG